MDYVVTDYSGPVEVVSDHITSYDFDQTLTTGLFHPNVDYDIVLTGRTFNEASYVNAELKKLGCEGIAVFFNPLSIKVRGNGTVESRILSAQHKINVLSKLVSFTGVIHYDDDEVQLNLIKQAVPSVKLMKVSRTDGTHNPYADTSGKSW